MDALELRLRLNATRLWLEMRKPSTLAKLQFGAPFFEDDEHSGGPGGGALGGGGDDDGWELAGRPAGGSNHDPDHDGDYHSRGLPKGPSLYHSIDVATHGDGDAHGGGGGGAGHEEAALQHGVLRGKLLVAVAECAFLTPGSGLVMEQTFAYSADPTLAPGLSRSDWAQSSRVDLNSGAANVRRGPDADGKKKSKKKKMEKEADKDAPGGDKGPKKEEADKDSPGGDKGPKKKEKQRAVLSLPGAVYVPPLSNKAIAQVAQLRGGGGGARSGAERDEVEEVMFWAHTAPLVGLLLKHLPAHVKVVLPPAVRADKDGSRQRVERHVQFLAELVSSLHLPAHRLVVSMPRGHHAEDPFGPYHKLRRELGPHLTLLEAGTVVYADSMFSVHTASPIASVALGALRDLRTFADPADSPYENPADDLVILLEDPPLDDSGEGNSGGATRVADWFDVRIALADALPNDQVVTYKGGLKPGDAAATELFKRAKLVVAPSGVVPALFLAVFSSADIPLLELAPPKAQAGAPEAPGAPEASEASEASEEEGGSPGGDPLRGGRAWTAAVGRGLGLGLVTVHARTDPQQQWGSSKHAFEAEALAAGARRALDRKYYDRAESSGSRGKEKDDQYQDLVDDLGGRGDAPEGGGEEEEAASQMGEITLQDIPEAADLAAQYGSGAVKVEAGLWDRDRLGELVQRLGDPSVAASLPGGVRLDQGGAALGVEYGDFAVQLLKAWPRAPRFWLVDPFAPPRPEGGPEGEAFEEKEADQLLSLDQRQHNARFEKVHELLRPWLAKGVAVVQRTPAREAAKFVEDVSLSLVYLDGDHAYAEVASDLSAWWPKVAPGGLVGGHDFTRAHAGGARAALEWAAAQGLTLFVTDVHKPRLDAARGELLPPCCPSWYFFKPAEDVGGAAIEAAARRVATEMNHEAAH